MTENYVLNELVKFVCEEPYYWNSGNQAEVDFVIQKGANIIPIEVKSRINVKARSLAEYRKKYEPKYSIVTSMKNDIGGNTVFSVPLYMLENINRLN